MLWAILVLTTLASTISLATASANRDLVREMRIEQRVRTSTGLIVTLMLASLAVAVLWTLYAFQVGDWRFAAIQWMPIVLDWIGRAANRAKDKTQRVVQPVVYR